MINKIIFTHDILRYVYDEKVSDIWLGDLIKYPVYKATGIELVNLIGCESFENKNSFFSQETFFNLSGINSNNFEQASAINFHEDSWNYLKSFIDENTLVIGTELGDEFRSKLTELGITYIGFWFHPYKLLDDILFLMTTNNSDIFNKLNDWKVPEDYFYQSALYWKHEIRRNYFGNGLPIEDNSILFIGQTYKDYSVFDGTKYLNITDYKQNITDYLSSFNKIYYSSHPYSGKNDSVDKYLCETKGVFLTDIPAYYLLASDNIKKVVSVSSSVLFEAKYFGKEIEYLFKPLFSIDEDFGKNSYISVYKNYFNPKFWGNVLSPITSTVSCKDEFFFEQSKNKIRNLLGSYHGYAYLDIPFKAIRKANKNEKMIDEILNRS